MSRSLKQIFKRGSRTFYWSSALFPRDVRADVTALYAFVRVADDFVDTLPQDRAGYDAFKAAYRGPLTTTIDPVIATFKRLKLRLDIPDDWVEAFFASMDQDLEGRTYTSWDDTLGYIYGSAEVIGLMMARIMHLTETSCPYAQLLGRAFQYINMLRDIAEDTGLGRTYIPHDVIASYGLPGIDQTSAQLHHAAFEKLLRTEVARYRAWQEEAMRGFTYIPHRYRIPLRIACALFEQTAAKIEKDPFIIFKEQVRPTRYELVRTTVTTLRHAASA